MEARLTDDERALADEGIERLEAAIFRGMDEKGLTLEESTDRHVDAICVLFPYSASIMFERMAEKDEALRRYRG